jgi:UDP-N-acetylmuramate--alanine ligase
MEEFARSFNNADVLFVSDIYAASEDPIEGVTAEIMTEAIKRFGHKNAQYIGALEGAGEVLRDELREGDIFITLGAGTVYRTGEQVLALLRERKERERKERERREDARSG